MENFEKLFCGKWKIHYLYDLKFIVLYGKQNIQKKDLRPTVKMETG